MEPENILPSHLVTDEVKSFSRWTGLEPEGLVDIMRYYQDSTSKHHEASAECLHRIVENIKAYCIARGVTKYSHWFNSWTESPAYKRDNIEHLSPMTLFQGEPDASSKPTGGLRSTYEARGYTVWDSKAPLFVLNGTTLCIPTLFISYKGAALDLKSPALRASAALSIAVQGFLDRVEPGQYDWKEVKVQTYAGPEQEYFLIPQALASQRPDFVHCKATVMGNPPPRNQQLEEHYLGSIPADVHEFFEVFNKELSKLGVTPSTDHNEVAPRQFEFAPMHDEAVRAADQNLLAMHILREVASQQGWLAVTHEKPFAGLNGSGKHLNFSICLVDRRTGELLRNLHAPPESPRQRLTFLLMLASTVVGIKRRAHLLRASVATRSNDQRLGGNEAPPAVISVYLGETIQHVIDELVERRGDKTMSNGASSIDLGLKGFPLVSRDNTDRNRTSPIAFTGNKFEFRMPGANSATYLPLAVLLASAADALDDATAMVTRRSIGDDEASLTRTLRDVFVELMEEAKPVIFDGDCYSKDWRAEAARRGLPEARDTASALEAFADPEQQEFLSRFEVWKPFELAAFYRAKMDEYAKLTTIEASTMLEMVSTAIKPSAMEHQTNLAERASALGEALEMADESGHASARPLKTQAGKALDTLAAFGGLVTSLEVGYDTVQHALRTVVEAGDEATRGRLAASELVPALEKLRETCDELETVLPVDLYPFPTCGELLYDDE